MTLDSVNSLGHSVRMAKPETELEYKQEFILRVAKSRTASGMKQWQIAEAMGSHRTNINSMRPGA
jgi:predicted XRE-type DNA-binding protein